MLTAKAPVRVKVVLKQYVLGCKSNKTVRQSYYSLSRLDGRRLIIRSLYVQKTAAPPTKATAKIFDKSAAAGTVKRCEVFRVVSPLGVVLNRAIEGAVGELT